MTDRQFLLLAICLLYLSECLYWARRGSVVFRRWAVGRRPGAVVAHPSPGLGTRRTGMVWVHPLPPFGAAFLSHVWPVSMTAAGVHAFVPTVINGNERPEQEGGYVPWDDIWKIARDGEVVWVNDRVFVRCNGEALGEAVERAMKGVWETPAAGRGRVVARLARRMTDAGRVRRELRRYALFAGPLGALRWQAHLLFAVVFGLLPSTVAVLPMRPFLPAGLVLLAGLLAIQVATFFYAHRRLRPRARGERWRSLLTMVFTPTASIRACDMVGKELLAAYHPLALAAVLCRGEERRRFARRVLLDYLHPMEPRHWSADADERAVTDGWHEMVLARLKALVRGAGMHAGELTAPPVMRDGSAKTYCPRCDGEYLVAEGTCSYCGGVVLKPAGEAIGV
jgi:hypothetical protein